MTYKITKNHISNHFEYDWIKYIIAIAVTITLVLVSFGQIASDREEEKFAMFFSAYGFQLTDYSKQTLDAISGEEYDQSIYGAPITRNASINFASLLSNDYPALYSTHGVRRSDAVVVPKSLLWGEDDETFTSAASYLPLDDNILLDMGIDSSYELLRLDENNKRIQSGGTVYAVRVDTLKNIGALALFDYEDYESEFYLAVSAEGKNIGKDNPSYRQTFFCLKVFFELYGN